MDSNAKRLKTEEFETIARVFIQTLSPFGYSLFIQANLWTRLSVFIFANLFKIRNLKKLSLLKGDENFFLGKKFGGGS